MALDIPKCSTWAVTFKRSCNERWARFRNRFRQRYYATRGKSIDPSTVLNETGTPDMIISNADTENTEILVHGVPLTETDEFDKLVEDYVSAVISQAAANLVLETKRQSLVNMADENVSVTSSIISQIADNVVAESLTNIAIDDNTNQSAGSGYSRNPTAGSGRRPRTIAEFIEMFGLADDENVADGLPPVSC